MVDTKLGAETALIVALIYFWIVLYTEQLANAAWFMG